MGGEQDAAPELPEETGKKRKRRGDRKSSTARQNVAHGKRGNGGEGNRGDT